MENFVAATAVHKAMAQVRNTMLGNDGKLHKDAYRCVCHHDVELMAAIVVQYRLKASKAEASAAWPTMATK